MGGSLVKGFFAAAIFLAMAAAPAAAASKPQTEAQAAKPASVAAPATRVVTDDLGRRVTLPAEVKRIVSLAPSLTETVYALGLDEELAGDTTFCEVPAAAKEKPHVGSPQSPNLEAIIALHPDVVLMASVNSYLTMDAIARLGIPVYGTDPHTVQETLASIERLADALGAGERGAALVDGLQARLDAVAAKLGERPMAHVLFVVQEDPLITTGQNTFVADALRWAGAESVITSRQDWPRIGMEEVVRLQPEWIVLAGEDMVTTKPQDFKQRPAWKDLRAVQLGRVTLASDELTMPAPGLVSAVEELARVLHPDAFAGAGAATGASGAAANGAPGAATSAGAPR